MTSTRCSLELSVQYYDDTAETQAMVIILSIAVTTCVEHVPTYLWDSRRSRTKCQIRKYTIRAAEMKINPITVENVKNQDFFTEMEWVSVTWMGETSQFFTKRGAQMHYIRKSYPRAFQNIKKY